MPTSTFIISSPTPPTDRCCTLSLIESSDRTSRAILRPIRSASVRPGVTGRADGGSRAGAASGQDGAEAAAELAQVQAVDRPEAVEVQVVAVVGIAARRCR